MSYVLKLSQYNCVALRCVYVCGVRVCVGVWVCERACVRLCVYACERLCMVCRSRRPRASSGGSGDGGGVPEGDGASAASITTARGTRISRRAVVRTLQPEELSVDTSTVLGSGPFVTSFAGVLRPRGGGGGGGTPCVCSALHFVRDEELWGACFGRGAGGAAQWREFVSGLHRELGAMASLRHPRAATLLGVVWWTSRLVAGDGPAGAPLLAAPLYIVTEAAGCTLEERLARARSGAAPLSPPAAAQLLLDAAEGLAVVHRRGRVHGAVRAGGMFVGLEDGRWVGRRRCCLQRRLLLRRQPRCCCCA